MGSRLSRFQWVRCQIDSLQHCHAPKDLRKALGSLPKTLDETYERILRSVADDYQEKFHRILEFLCFSECLMMLGELAEVVTVAINSDGRAHYDSENHMRGPSDVLEMCGSLVSLSEPSYVSSDQWYSDETFAAWIVRLSHFSVKEFLVSERTREGRGLKYSVNAELANRSIAMTCLVYLM